MMRLKMRRNIGFSINKKCRSSHFSQEGCFFHHLFDQLFFRLPGVMLPSLMGEAEEIDRMIGKSFQRMRDHEDPGARHERLPGAEFDEAPFGLAANLGGKHFNRLAGEAAGKERFGMIAIGDLTVLQNLRSTNEPDRSRRIEDLAPDVRIVVKCSQRRLARVRQGQDIDLSAVAGIAPGLIAPDDDIIPVDGFSGRPNVAVADNGNALVRPPRK
ncbi:MAG TPA: hypothetical protein VN004_06010 [Pseudorhodoplanes sp.]|nr:hypothetical protein [Pseudorhodoplanes sp.]HWV41167.1 hypothetical protein [Pseudorhodoplanes sp.]